ncbi:MAG: hypothetical protein ACPLPW_08365, partial [bacterium]
MNTLLFIILDRFQKKFLDVFKVLDDLLAIISPTNGDVTKLKNNVPNTLVTYSYFFGKCENPNWLELLMKKGFFQDAPEPEQDEEGDIKFPPWPQAHYLARMASLKPEVVVEVILQIPDTENVMILEDFAEAALNMPPDFAARLLEKGKIWARSPYFSRLQEKLGMLVAHLARGDKADEALELARVLLEILPDPAAEEAFKRGTNYDSPEPRARFETWEYERILKEYFPELLKAAETRA